MYLRQVSSEGTTHYILRESVWRHDCWTYRDLLDLGEDPESFIIYPGGNSFYFKPELEEALDSLNVAWETEELETVFYPFLEPHVQRILDTFGSRYRPKSKWRRCATEELLQYQQQLHSFDKRRLHFLRCGRVDIGNLDGRPWKFLNILLDKSRDEIEHIIEGMEMQLRPYEIRPYIFTALHLQSCFPQHLLRNHPAALDPQRVDAYFLESICVLNKDAAFFRGVPDHNPRTLHPYLVRYVINYFDHDYVPSRFWNETVEDFIRQRFARHSSPQKQPSVDQACARLGINRQEYEKMSPRDLVHCYRTRAKEVHPDKGGDHEAFVQITEAYEYLLGRKQSHGKSF